MIAGVVVPIQATREFQDRDEISLRKVAKVENSLS